MERWTGRVAVVTGAASGIGIAIAEELVKMGMNVVGVDKVLDPIKELAEKLADESGSLKSYECDLGKPENISAMFDWVEEEVSRVNLYVNCAGVSYAQAIINGQPENWQEMCDVNIISVAVTLKEVIRLMNRTEVDDGQIIHIGSLLGHHLPRECAAHFFAGTQHAVTTLLDGARRELDEYGSSVRITQISPGIVRTPFLEKQVGKQSAMRVMGQCGIMEASDIVESVKYVLSVPDRVQIVDISLKSVSQMKA